MPDIGEVSWTQAKLPWPVAVAIAVAVAVLAFVALAAPPSPGNPRSPWNETYFPNLPVVTHDGRELKFYDDLIKDKIVVINFFYSSCSNICPLTTARLSQVKDMLGDRVGRDIFFYSITLDPLLDGPDTLKKYAETYNAGPGWLFLTGKPDDIDLIRHKLGERSRSLAEHRNDVMLGNDATGEWGRNSAFTDLEQLAAAIREMDPVWREQVQPVTVAAAPAPPVVLSDTPGQGLFLKACAACHTIGEGTRVGPDLAGVTARRDHGWLTSFLMAPDDMRARKDPIAVALDAEFPGTKMPNLNLSPGDVADLMTYLAAKSGKAAANQSVHGDVRSAQ